MLQDPLVSIAIPFYNAENFLTDSILSVLNQTYAHWELLLLDDGSTDSSLKIALSFKDVRIKVISDGENKGLVYRLNQSVDMSKGLYYARMDADDIMHPERIARQLKELAEHPEIDILGTSYYSIDKDNCIKYYNLLPRTCVIRNLRVLHPSVIGKRAWFLAHPYDARFVRIEDTELWFRVIDHTYISNLSEPLMFYREFGVPTFVKYIRTQIGAMRLYSKLCFKKDHHLFFAKLLFFTVIKIGVCLCLVSVGRTDKLVVLRKKNECFFDRLQAQRDLTLSIRH